MFCLLVVLVRLLVPMQVIDWKDFSEVTYNVLLGTFKPYPLTDNVLVS